MHGCFARFLFVCLFVFLFLLLLLYVTLTTNAKPVNSGMQFRSLRHKIYRLQSPHPAPLPRTASFFCDAIHDSGPTSVLSRKTEILKRNVDRMIVPRFSNGREIDCALFRGCNEIRIRPLLLLLNWLLPFHISAFHG